MNEIDLHKMQEAEGFGAFLIESIAASVGIEPDPEKIDRAIYKGTACGAWVRFDEEGVIVGTIVEGSDAEYSERISLTDIEPGEEGAKILCERFWEAIQACEDFSDEAWSEMEAEDY